MWREKVPRDDQETLKEIQSRKTRKKRTGSTKVTNKQNIQRRRRAEVHAMLHQSSATSSQAGHLKTREQI